MKYIPESLQLIKLLRLGGDLFADAKFPADETVYKAPLVDAVKSFQRRHGIVYATVIVTEDGIVHFYDDIYGHDAALEKALAKGYPYPG